MTMQSDFEMLYVAVSACEHFIDGVDVSLQTPAHNVILQAPYKFYFGGSRRMAERLQKNEGYIPVDSQNVVITITDETDYDYYITYSSEISMYLIENGFSLSPASNAYYLDSEAVEILARDNVQVVLRRDAEFYKMIFDNIDPIIYYTYLWKSAPHSPNRELIGPFFDMLFNLAHTAEITDEEHTTVY